MRLSKDQKQVADKIYGSMLCLASAGSGKTTAIVGRIKKLLTSDAQVAPYNILCMTFSDAGAHAMRSKLLEEIGADAHMLNITTFHSFASDILMSNNHLFGQKDLKPVSEVEQMEILYSIIDTLPPDHVLVKGKADKYYETTRMKHLFSVMKSENYDLVDVNEFVEEFIDTLHEDEEYRYKRANKKRGIKAGDKKMHLIDAEIEKVNTMIAAAELYSRYNEGLVAMQRYDYDDMIITAIASLKDYPNTLRRLQERYQYLLIDEAQDTNAIQFELANILLSFWDDPNVLVVGDINQTIYAFQGAEERNIEDYVLNHSPILAVMNESYRCSQPILDVASNVIKADQEGISKANVDQDVIPKVYECNNIFEEEFMIVEEIERLLSLGVEPNDICVMYRKHRQSENIIRELRSKGIEVNIKKRINVLEEPLIRQLMNLMRYIDLRSGIAIYEPEGLLMKVLNSAFFNLPYSDVEKWIAEGCNLELASDEIKKVWVIIEQMVSDVSTLSLFNLMVRLINKCGVLDFASKDNAYIRQLKTFMVFIEGEISRNPTSSIRQLIGVFDNMENFDLSLPMVSSIGSEDGICFSSVHGAKGLEWEYVYLIGCTDTNWEKSRSGTNRYSFPSNMKSDDNNLMSNRRLFYVAVTRAKQYLTISFPKSDENGRYFSPSVFVSDTKLDITNYNNNNYKEHFAMQMKEVLETPSPLLSSEFVDEKVEKFVLSASSLNSYLKCQKEFFFKNILKLPYAQTKEILIGNATHDILKRINDYQGRPTNNVIDSLIAKALPEHIALADKGDVEIVKFRVEENIKAYYTTNYVRGGSLNEYYLRSAIDEIPVKAFFDQIRFNGDDATIVEYKTGNLKRAKRELSRSGEYFAQAVFYKLAFKTINWQPWRYVGSEAIILNGGESTTIEIDITIEDEVEMLNKIKQVSQGISDRIFVEGCNDCEWCELFNQNKSLL